MKKTIEMKMLPFLLLSSLLRLKESIHVMKIKVLELITFWWTEGLLNDPNVFKTNIYDSLNVYYRALLWDKVIER